MVATLLRRLEKAEASCAAGESLAVIFQTVDEATGERTPSDAEVIAREAAAERAGRNVVKFVTIYEAAPTP